MALRLAGEAVFPQQVFRAAALSRERFRELVLVEGERSRLAVDIDADGTVGICAVGRISELRRERARDGVR